MSNHWDPGTFETFRQALDDGQCEVVLHGWTRDWALDHGWSIFGFYSRWWFLRCLILNRQRFWLAYRAGAFDLHLHSKLDISGQVLD